MASASVKKAATKSSKAASKKEVFEKKDRVYAVTKGGGIVYSLPQGGVTVYDETSNTVRELRYCPNERSVWRDEQSEFAKREHVMFYDKLLYVPYTKPNLIKYLDLHPGNAANGGDRFHMVDNEKNAEEQLNQEFEVLDAVNAVRDKGIDDLVPIALFYNINVDRPASEIRFDLLQQARSNPGGFLQSFDNPMVAVRATVKKADMYQVIKIDPSGCYWFDSGRLIVSTPAGQDSIDVLTRFCMTDKGALVLSELEQKVGNL
jgi:hypothetical protein|tara:strand:- start:10302 stop:11084 length:783 start_codon:yes stop_codon:yes gene_type:complete